MRTSLRLRINYLIAGCLGIWYLLAGPELPAQDSPVGFISFYASDRDFLAGKTLQAEERLGLAHLEVFYNTSNQPLLKNRYASSGDLLSQEVLSYDDQNQLSKRAVLDGNRRVQEVIHYGEQEPWSVEFRRYVIPPSLRLTLNGQHTVFRFDGQDRVQQITFRSVDLVPYGQVRLQYDHRGNLSGETWVLLPEATVVRRFVYQTDIFTDTRQIWEYGRSGKQVSHLVLDQAPADQLYKVPPPRTGNILDEVGIIMRELQAGRTLPAGPVIIPRAEWDVITLPDGESLRVEFVGIEGTLVRFRMPDEPRIVNLPLAQIQSVMSRHGARIYPP